MRKISYKPLWHTLLDKDMNKEDLRLKAGLTTNMIANMGKNKRWSVCYEADEIYLWWRL